VAAISHGPRDDDLRITITAAVATT